MVVVAAMCKSPLQLLWHKCSIRVQVRQYVLIITPMHVLHLETGRHLYGGPRQVIELMRGLEARGVQSTLACPTGSAIAAAAAGAGLTVVTHELGGDLDVASVSFLVAEVRRVISSIEPGAYVDVRTLRDATGAEAGLSVGAA